MKTSNYKFLGASSSMFFILDELEICEELKKRPYLRSASSKDVIQKMAQERRQRTTTVAELKAFISSSRTRTINFTH